MQSADELRHDVYLNLLRGKNVSGKVIQRCMVSILDIWPKLILIRIPRTGFGASADKLRHDVYLNLLRGKNVSGKAMQRCMVSILGHRA